jgi:putative endonuclease
LPRRIAEHYYNRKEIKTFTGKYQCYYLLYYEIFNSASDAVYREKQLKGWKRNRKEELIASENPDWNFLNYEIMEWPPIDPN